MARHHALLAALVTTTAISTSGGVHAVGSNEVTPCKARVPFTSTSKPAARTRSAVHQPHS